MIPNILHFVYGFKEQTEEFELFKYIAIESAYQVNKPDAIYFYYWYEPFGQWWDKIKPRLTLVKTPIPTEIFGRPIKHYAHAADIVRLQKLNEIGGIYLDIDTICLKPFTDLLDNEFVMGIQGGNYGLCNATMLAKPNSKFGRKWFDYYRTFDHTIWDYHSVRLPLTISKLYPEDITILKPEAFFYPLWNPMPKILFNENIDIEEYKLIITNSYSIHLWESFHINYLKSLTPEKILQENTLYNIFARKFLKNTMSIVMLTYNRLDKTKECLESYLRCLNNDYIEELLILDNNSADDTKKFLKQFGLLHKKIRIIYGSENLGVCGGRIILFKEAKGDIIVSLDSDAKLISDDFFKLCIKYLYSEDTGIVGISGAFLDKSLVWGSHRDIEDSDPNILTVDLVAGCCQVFRKNLNVFGVQLDPYYGKFWVEDSDFSIQVLQLGKKNLRIPQNKLMNHSWGGSGQTTNLQPLLERNWNYFVKKWSSKINSILEFKTPSAAKKTAISRILKKF